MSLLAFSCYKEIIAAGENVMEVGDTIPIPRFSQEHTLEIISEAMQLLRTGQPLVYSDGNVVLVGDLHGSFHDMLRIFTYYGYPPATKYVFLGDYVDRGDFSLEVITFLFVCYVQFPDHIILLRGNHEFEQTNKLYGFKSSVENEYGNDRVWLEFNECFGYLPIACILDKTTICLHGGISKNFTNISALRKLEFPIFYDNKIVSDITWSDPTSATTTYMRNERGLGQLFGNYVFLEFLKKSDLTMMIRAHECVDGVKIKFNGKLLTVFSSSNYGSYNNRSGSLFFKNGNDYDVKIFHALEKMSKSSAYFFNVICPRQDSPLRIKSCRNSFNVGSPIISNDPFVVSPSKKKIGRFRNLSLRRNSTSLSFN